MKAEDSNKNPPPNPDESDKNLAAQSDVETTLDANDVQEILTELGIDPSQNSEKLVSVLLTKFDSQSTNGPYPPPMMLKEYMDIDPKIVEEILGGAKSQREHRMALENRVTDASQKRMTNAQKDQTMTAIVSMIVGAALASIPPFFGVTVPAIIPIALIAIGVGGRPTATVLTKLIAQSKD